MSKTIRPKVLLIDDDLDLLKTATLLLRDSFDVLTESSVYQGKASVRNNSIDVVVVDLNFEGQEDDGIEFIDWAFHEHPDLSIIVLSGDRSTARVVEAMRRPLVDFIPKSKDYERDLRMAINKGFELKQNREQKQGDFTFQTRSPAVRKVLDTIERIVKSDVACSILITGETGAGKEVLAKHFAARMKKKLVAANMASIPREMAESQLFAHMKGAFTGAHMNQLGLVAQAHGGIFFLDELGECSPSVQAKLLRVIQEKEIQPLGAHRTTQIDVQFIAATNCNLEKMVDRGEFRLDLLQRLNAVTLHLPPLRERPEDIEFYTMLFLKEIASDKPFVIRASGIEALLQHPWRGNTRELHNVIQKIVILSNKSEVDSETVRAALDVGNSEFGDDESSGDIKRGDLLNALEATNGNRTKAAQVLGVHPVTVFRNIKKYGIGTTITSRSGRPRMPPKPQKELA